MPFYKTDGSNIYYEQVGSGPPLVLLHGMGLDSGIFHGLISSLIRQFTVISIDMPGCGQSETIVDKLAVNTIAKDILDLMIHLKLNQPLVLGHSMGGFVALQLAMDYPTFLSGLCLLSTAASGKFASLDMTRKAQKAMDSVAGNKAERWEALISVSVGKAFLSNQQELLKQIINERARCSPTGRILKYQRIAANVFDLTKRLSEITLPAVVLHGTDDQLIHFNKGRFLADELGNSEFFPLAGVGHMAMYEAPKEVVSALATLLLRTNHI